MFEDWARQRLIPTGRTSLRRGKVTLSGMLFIMTLFHLSPFRDFKHFRIYGIRQKHRGCFGELPTCSRFVTLISRLFMPCCVLLHSLRGQETGILVADSTKLAVCHNIRISHNRVFEGLARRGPMAFCYSAVFGVNISDVDKLLIGGVFHVFHRE